MPKFYRYADLDHAIRGKFRDKKGRYTPALWVKGYAATGKAGGYEYATTIRSQTTTFGLNRFLSILRGLPREMGMGIERAHVRIAKKLLSVADYYVPTDKGPLRASGKIVQGTGSVGGTLNTRVSGMALPLAVPTSTETLNRTIAIQYGGHTAPYAAIVHQDTSLRHGIELVAHQRTQAAAARKGRDLTKRDLKKIDKDIQEWSTSEEAQEGPHRPQEQALWMDKAWDMTVPFAEATLATEVGKVYRKLSKTPDSPVYGPFLKGLKKAGVPKALSPKVGGQT
jgi:hypothetical protein